MLGRHSLKFYIQVHCGNLVLYILPCTGSSSIKLGLWLEASQNQQRLLLPNWISNVTFTDVSFFSLSGAKKHILSESVITETAHWDRWGMITVVSSGNRTKVHKNINSVPLQSRHGRLSRGWCANLCIALWWNGK